MKCKGKHSKEKHRKKGDVVLEMKEETRSKARTDE